MQIDFRSGRFTRMRTLAYVATGFCTAAAVVLLFPSASPRAAGDDTAASTNGDSSVFGSATPSDKFIQSFQQQVSQQLQAALAQSNEQQVERLQQFEQQQKALGDEVQALEQSLAGSGPGSHLATGDAGSSTSADSDPDPPRVNARHASAGDTGSDLRAATDSSSSLLAALGDPAETARPLPVAAAAGIRPGRPGDPNIAPHGFIEGRLLNGVVAVMGGPDRESVVALQGEYQSANGFLTDLDGCFALVQGRPEIAAGRIDFKLSRLTCNFQDGASRTWDTAGWLVDADGIRGVRATIVENVGRKALAAAAGGAIGGVGQRLSQEQYQINTISSGTGGPVSGSSSTFIGSTGVDALGGAASGAANAIGQSITEYYNLFTPSLQVGGGTPVTVVLANDLRVPPAGKDITQTHLASP